MVTARMSRVIVALASLLFAGAALAIWAAPEQAVQRLGLETVRATGLSVVRADIGGLFAGMSILCGAAAWTRRGPWVFAALAVLVSIVVGRSVGWISNRAIGGDVLEFAVEVGLVAALLGLARGSRSDSERPHGRHQVTRTVRILPGSSTHPKRRAPHSGGSQVSDDADGFEVRAGAAGYPRGLPVMMNSYGRYSPIPDWQAVAAASEGLAAGGQ